MCFQAEMCNSSGEVIPIQGKNNLGDCKSKKNATSNTYKTSNTNNWI